MAQNHPTLSQKIGLLRRGQALFLVAPNIQAQMTGVWRASVDKSARVRVDYLDGTYESAPASPELLATIADDLDVFRLTSFVQSLRPAGVHA